MDNIITKPQADLLYLLAVCVNQVPSDEEYVSQMDLADLSKRAEFHLVTAVAYTALSGTQYYKDLRKDTLSDEEKTAIRQMKERTDKAVRKVMLMDADRAKLLALLDQTHIWYMPLKGILLKEMYPKYGIRQMADNDILFDTAYQEKLKDLMEQAGYRTEYYGTGNHDVYMKEPIYNYEMHNTLFYPQTSKEFYEFFDTDESKLLWDEEVNPQGERVHYGRHFSITDTYLYILAHDYKHFSQSGTGVRTLLDIYCYLKKYSDQMDFDFIQKECEEIGIAEYEQASRNLALKVFAKPLTFDELEKTLTKEEEELCWYYCTSGVYGFHARGVKNRFNKFAGKEDYSLHVKLRYFFSRLFPPPGWFMEHYPLLKKCPFLIPFYALYRCSIFMLMRWKRAVREIREIMLLKK